jgi:hypothetical protein
VRLFRSPGREAAPPAVEELAALADGSLAPERRAALDARVAGSAELADLLAEQLVAVALVRGAAAEVDAPETLRAHVATRRAERRRRLLVAIPAAAVVAAVVAAAVAGWHAPAAPLRTALAGTALAPGARGKATLTRTRAGWRIELEARGLPRLDGGRFYEAWLRDARGRAVAAGTFNEGARVTLWAGVSPKLFATLVVTRERVGGDAPSWRERVLAGPILRRGST